MKLFLQHKVIVLFLLAFLSKGVFDVLQVNEAFAYELMEGGEQEESQNKESKEKLELFSYSEQFPIKSSFFTELAKTSAVVNFIKESWFDVPNPPPRVA